MITAEDFLSLSISNEIDKDIIETALRESNSSEEIIEKTLEKIENVFITKVFRLNNGFSDEKIHKIDKNDE